MTGESKVIAFLVAAGLALIVFAFATTPAKASVLDPLTVANKAWPGSPCAGKLRMTFDATLSLRKRAGEAIGVLVGDDGSFVTQSCDFTVDPVYWAKVTPSERCAIAAHEAGHLAGLHHSPVGVMREDRGGYYEPCATLRERIEHALMVRTGATDFDVQCGRLVGRVITCRVYLTSHTARFRVSVSGDVFVARRVHGAVLLLRQVD